MFTFARVLQYYDVIIIFAIKVFYHTFLCRTVIIFISP